MDRRGQLFNAQERTAADPNLIRTHVNFLHRKEAGRRRPGQLRPLSPEEKMLCALRKVLAKMSADDKGARRFFIVSPHCRVLDRHVSPGAKDGDGGTYRMRGRCQIGIAHRSGDAATKMVEFVVSFRDVEDSMGLPDVEYFEPTAIDEIDPRTVL